MTKSSALERLEDCVVAAVQATINSTAYRSVIPAMKLAVTMQVLMSVVQSSSSRRSRHGDMVVNISTRFALNLPGA